MIDATFVEVPRQRNSRDRWVYLWADGIYSGLRAEDERLCALVVIGVNERGEKHFLTRTGMLSMIFKLGMSAEQNWRRLRGFKWLAKVIRGVKFRDGVEVRSKKRTSLRQEGSRVAA